MSNVSDTVNIHSLTHKLHQTTSHTPLTNESQTTSKDAKYILHSETKQIRIATGCTPHINTQYIHDKTHIFNYYL